MGVDDAKFTPQKQIPGHVWDGWQIPMTTVRGSDGPQAKEGAAREKSERELSGLSKRQMPDRRR